MAVSSFTSRSSLKTSILHLLPAISSSSYSSFSSHCRRHDPTTTTTTSLPSFSRPAAKKVPFTVSAHGVAWQDPYHWMKNTKDPDFLNYLNQENRYGQAFMADTQTQQETLVKEMKARLPIKVSTPPERWGPGLYYQYIPEGKEYPVLCRRLETEESGWGRKLLNYARGRVVREKILLDWNEIAEQYGYVHVGTCRVSPDHNFLAYTLDITGSEQFMLQVKDLRNGYTAPMSQIDGVVSVAWAQDGRTLFYTITDENQRPYRLMCKNLGSDELDDIPVFTESDASFCLDITSTKDGKFITVNSNSRTSSEVYLIDATNPLNGLQRAHKRVSGVQYFLEHHYGSFYVLTNAPLSENKEWSGESFYLARCPLNHIKSSTWKNVILPGEDMTFQDMDIFDGHLVLFINTKGFPSFCSIDLPVNNTCKNHLKIENLDPWFFPLPSNLCSIVPGSNHDFMKSAYRVVISSPVMPDVIVDYNMSDRTFSIVQQEDGRYDYGHPGLCSLVNKLDTPEHVHTQDDVSDQNIELRRWKEFSGAYCCESKEVIAHDSFDIPLTILYSRKAWRRDQSPGILIGYGAYGEALDKSWCPDRLSLLDRGWVVAFADVRGGSGSNSSWHKSGSGMDKHNSIYDFVSCGNYLVNEGYVHRDRLGAIGHSAGGLLVAAAINMSPDLFRAVILKVPFLDICNTLLDPSLPLTMLDYEEFGNPQIQSQFECIRRYSPYDNIPGNICFPSVLVSTSFHDSRVGVWEAAKWVSRVRDRICSNCSHSVILKTNMAGGHFGEGGYHKECEETAFDYAFLMKIMGNLDGSK